jgi:hypothetical protein
MALNNRPQVLSNSHGKEVNVMLRGPLTRRQKVLAALRSDNEKSSALLNLNEEVLGAILAFLPGQALAVLETVCTHFRYGSWVASKGAMPLAEFSAKRKLDQMSLGDMPPGFRYASPCVGQLYTLSEFSVLTTPPSNWMPLRRKMKWSRKLSVVEQRGTLLTADSITMGMWVRVKTDMPGVKKLCRGDGEDSVRPRPLL